MRTAQNFKFALAITGCVAALAQTAVAFEGQIKAVVSQGTEIMPLLYTVGTNFLRIEVTATNWPNPVDIMDLNSGALTLLLPHNRSFVRLKPAAMTPSGPDLGVGSSAFTRPGLPHGGTPNQTQPGGLPSGIGPQSRPGAPAVAAGVPPAVEGGILPPGFASESATASGKPNVFPPGGTPGSTAGGTPVTTPGIPAIPTMPIMPMPMMDKIELQATGQKTNFLGFACERYEFKQRGETLEIWATDQLLPFQPYIRHQPHSFGPRMIEEQWPGLLTAKKLFPLRASLRFDNGAERFRFEVKSVTPQKLIDADAKLFQPPPEYHEIQPLPF